LLVVDWRGEKEEFEGESEKGRKNLYQEMREDRRGKGSLRQKGQEKLAPILGR
jgi:hypothetical protein